jgi:hypothetical protein
MAQEFEDRQWCFVGVVTQRLSNLDRRNHTNETPALPEVPV